MTEARGPLRLSLEGSIGAGKSSFLRMIQDHLGPERAYTMTEPVDTWKDVRGHNLLEAFYQDPVGHGYLFQTYAFMSRLRATKQCFDVCKGRVGLEVQVIERSAYSDRYVFAQNAYETGLIRDLDWAAYLDLWSFYTQLAHSGSLDGVIFLDVSVDCCHERTRKRARPEEKAVSREYLEQLQQKHDAWLPQGAKHSSDGIPLLRLDGNQEFERDPLRRAALLAEVDAFVEQLKQEHKVSE